MGAMDEIKFESEITYPICIFQKTETTSLESCQFFYECPSCESVIRPKFGDCCVFCSFGSVTCPPIQKQTLSAKE